MIQQGGVIRDPPCGRSDPERGTTLGDERIRDIDTSPRCPVDANWLLASPVPGATPLGA